MFGCILFSFRPRLAHQPVAGRRWDRSEREPLGFQRGEVPLNPMEWEPGTNLVSGVKVPPMGRDAFSFHGLHGGRHAPVLSTPPVEQSVLLAPLNRLVIRVQWRHQLRP